MDVDFQAKPELCFNFVDKIQSYPIFKLIYPLRSIVVQTDESDFPTHPYQLLIYKIQIVTHKSYELAPLLQTLAFVSLVCVNQLRDPKDVWVVLAHPGIKANFVR
jgi:hypothetical protein